MTSTVASHARPIVSVTLNPAVDEAIAIGELELGRLNRCRLDAVDPGGKALNASRVIARLGRPTLALGFVAGATGAFIRSRLDREGVRHAFDDVEGLTRINVMVLEHASARRTRLYLPGPSVTARDLDRIYARLALVAPDAVVIAGGSLPPGLPPAVYGDLVRWLRERGARTIVDASGAALEHALASRPALIKPNVEEATEVLGRPIADDDDALDAAAIFRRLGAERVVISQGSRGAVGLDETGAWKVRPPAVIVRSTIGSGDSMVAGLAIALNEGLGLEQGLRLGAAAGAATCAVIGTELGSRTDIERLVPLVAVERRSDREVAYVHRAAS